MKIRLLKTLMGEYGGNQGDVIDAPNYVANRYIQVGYAERYKPCNCDDCKDGEPCPEVEDSLNIEEAVAFFEDKIETAEVTPTKKKRGRPKKNNK
jgi:hypothetical protein